VVAGLGPRHRSRFAEGQWAGDRVAVVLVSRPVEGSNRTVDPTWQLARKGQPVLISCDGS